MHSHSNRMRTGGKTPHRIKFRRSHLLAIRFLPTLGRDDLKQDIDELHLGDVYLNELSILRVLELENRAEVPLSVALRLDLEGDFKGSQYGFQLENENLNAVLLTSATNAANSAADSSSQHADPQMALADPVGSPSDPMSPHDVNTASVIRTFSSSSYSTEFCYLEESFNELFNQIDLISTVTLEPHKTQKIILNLKLERRLRSRDHVRESDSGGAGSSLSSFYSSDEDQLSAQGTGCEKVRGTLSFAIDGAALSAATETLLPLRGLACRSVLKLDIREIHFNNCVPEGSYVKDFTVWNRSDIRLVFRLVCPMASMRRTADVIEFSDYDTGQTLMNSACHIPAYSHERIRVTFRPKEIGERTISVDVVNVHDARNIKRITIHTVTSNQLHGEGMVICEENGTCLTSGSVLSFGDCMAGVDVSKVLSLKNSTDLPIHCEFTSDRPKEITFELKDLSDILVQERHAHSHRSSSEHDLLSPSLSPLVTGLKIPPSFSLNEPPPLQTSNTTPKTRPSLDRSITSMDSDEELGDDEADELFKVEGTDVTSPQHAYGDGKALQYEFEEDVDDDMVFDSDKPLYISGKKVSKGTVGDKSKSVSSPLIRGSKTANGRGVSSPLLSFEGRKAHNNATNHRVEGVNLGPGMECTLLVWYKPGSNFSEYLNSMDGDELRSSRVTKLTKQTFRLHFRCFQMEGTRNGYQRKVYDASLGRNILVRSRTCTSVVAVAPSVLSFGDCNIGEQKSLCFRVENLSELPTVVEGRVKSKIVSMVPSAPLALQPKQSREVKVEIIPRKVNPRYSRSITFKNLKNSDNSPTLTVHANNVDSHHLVTHSQFYTLRTRLDSSYLRLENATVNGDHYLVFYVRNLTQDPLTLGIETFYKNRMHFYRVEREPECDSKRSPSPPPLSSEHGSLATSVSAHSSSNSLNVMDDDESDALPELKQHETSNEDIVGRIIESTEEMPPPAAVEDQQQLKRRSNTLRSRIHRRRSVGSSLEASMDLQEAWTDDEYGYPSAGGGTSGEVTPPIVPDGSKVAAVEASVENGASSSSLGPMGVGTDGMLRLSAVPEERVKGSIMDRAPSSTPRKTSNRSAKEIAAQGGNKSPGLKRSKTADRARNALEFIEQLEEYHTSQIMQNRGAHSVLMDEEEGRASNESEVARIRRIQREFKELLNGGRFVPIAQEKDSVVIPPNTEVPILTRFKPLSDGTLHETDKIRMEKYKIMIVLPMHYLRAFGSGGGAWNPDPRAGIRDLLLKARVCRSALAVDQKYFNFGRLTTSSVCSKVLTVRNLSAVPLLYYVSKTGSISSGFLRILEGVEGRVRPFGTSDIHFEFQPTLPGPFEEKLEITNVQDPQSAVAVNIKAKVVKPETFALPHQHTVLRFGQCTTDRWTDSKRIKIRNITKQRRKYVVEVVCKHTFLVCSGRMTLDESSLKSMTLEEEKELEDELEKLEQKLRIATTKKKEDKIKKLTKRKKEINSVLYGPHSESREKHTRTADVTNAASTENQYASDSESESDLASSGTSNSSSTRSKRKSSSRKYSFVLQPDTSGFLDVAVQVNVVRGSTTNAGTCAELRTFLADALSRVRFEGHFVVYEQKNQDVMKKVTFEAEVSPSRQSESSDVVPRFGNRRPASWSDTRGRNKLGPSLGPSLGLALGSDLEVSVLSETCGADEPAVVFRLGQEAGKELLIPLDSAPTDSKGWLCRIRSLRSPLIAERVRFSWRNEVPKSKLLAFDAKRVDFRVPDSPQTTSIMDKVVIDRKKLAPETLPLEIDLHQTQELSIVALFWRFSNKLLKSTETVRNHLKEQLTEDQKIRVGCISLQLVTPTCTEPTAEGSIPVYFVQQPCSFKVSEGCELDIGVHMLRAQVESSFVLENQSSKVVKFVIVADSEPKGGAGAATAESTTGSNSVAFKFSSGELAPHGCVVVPFEYISRIHGRHVHQFVVRNLADRFDSITATVIVKIKRPVYVRLPHLDRHNTGTLETLRLGQLYVHPISTPQRKNSVSTRPDTRNSSALLRRKSVGNTLLSDDVKSRVGNTNVQKTTSDSSILDLFRHMEVEESELDVGSSTLGCDSVMGAELASPKRVPWDVFPPVEQLLAYRDGTFVPVHVKQWRPYYSKVSCVTIQSQSKEPMICSITSNLKKQCYVYTDADLTQDAEQIRLEGHSQIDLFVAFQPRLSSEAWASGVCKDFVGGIRVALHKADASTLDSQVVTSGETAVDLRSHELLAEFTVKFQGVAGTSILQASPKTITYEMKEFNGRSQEINGTFKLHNRTKQLPLKFAMYCRRKRGKEDGLEIDLPFETGELEPDGRLSIPFVIRATKHGLYERSVVIHNLSCAGKSQVVDIEVFVSNDSIELLNAQLGNHTANSTCSTSQPQSSLSTLNNAELQLGSVPIIPTHTLRCLQATDPDSTPDSVPFRVLESTGLHTMGSFSSGVDVAPTNDHNRDLRVIEVKNHGSEPVRLRPYSDLPLSFEWNTTTPSTPTTSSSSSVLEGNDLSVESMEDCSSGSVRAAGQWRELYPAQSAEFSFHFPSLAETEALPSEQVLEGKLMPFQGFVGLQSSEESSGETSCDFVMIKRMAVSGFFVNPQLIVREKNICLGKIGYANAWKPCNFKTTVENPSEIPVYFTFSGFPKGMDIEHVHGASKVPCSFSTARSQHDKSTLLGLAEAQVEPETWILEPKEKAEVFISFLHTPEFVPPGPQTFEVKVLNLRNPVNIEKLSISAQIIASFVHVQLQPESQNDVDKKRFLSTSGPVNQTAYLPPVVIPPVPTSLYDASLCSFDFVLKNVYDKKLEVTVKSCAADKTLSELFKFAVVSRSTNAPLSRFKLGPMECMDIRVLCKVFSSSRFPSEWLSQQQQQQHDEIAHVGSITPDPNLREPENRFVHSVLLGNLKLELEEFEQDLFCTEDIEIYARLVPGKSFTLSASVLHFYGALSNVTRPLTSSSTSRPTPYSLPFSIRNSSESFWIRNPSHSHDFHFEIRSVPMLRFYAQTNCSSPESEKCVRITPISIPCEGRVPPNESMKILVSLKQEHCVVPDETSHIPGNENAPTEMILQVFDREAARPRSSMLAVNVAISFEESENHSSSVSGGSSISSPRTGTCLSQKELLAMEANMIREDRGLPVQCSSPSYNVHESMTTSPGAGFGLAGSAQRGSSITSPCFSPMYGSGIVDSHGSQSSYVPFLTLRGCTPARSHQMRMEESTTDPSTSRRRSLAPDNIQTVRFSIDVGQQTVRNGGEVEWEITIENTFKESVEYRLYTAHEHATSWLKLSRDSGILEGCSPASPFEGREMSASMSMSMPSTPTSSNVSYHKIILYFIRDTVGIFSTFLILENLRNACDLKIIRINMEVIADLSAFRNNNSSLMHINSADHLFKVLVSSSYKKRIHESYTTSITAPSTTSSISSNGGGSDTTNNTKGVDIVNTSGTVTAERSSSSTSTSTSTSSTSTSSTSTSSTSISSTSISSTSTTTAEIISPKGTGTSLQAPVAELKRINYGEIFFSNLYHNHSLVIVNCSGISLDFVLSSNCHREVSFSLSSTSFKEVNSVSIDENSQLQVFIHFRPLPPPSYTNTSSDSKTSDSSLNSDAVSISGSSPNAQSKHGESKWQREVEVYINCRLVKDFRETILLQATCYDPQLKVGLSTDLPTEVCLQEDQQQMIGNSSSYSRSSMLADEHLAVSSEPSFLGLVFAGRMKSNSTLKEGSKVVERHSVKDSKGTSASTAAKLFEIVGSHGEYRFILISNSKHDVARICLRNDTMFFHLELHSIRTMKGVVVKAELLAEVLHRESHSSDHMINVSLPAHHTLVVAVRPNFEALAYYHHLWENNVEEHITVYNQLQYPEHYHISLRFTVSNSANFYVSPTFRDAYPLSTLEETIARFLKNYNHIWHLNQELYDTQHLSAESSFTLKTPPFPRIQRNRMGEDVDLTSCSRSDIIMDHINSSIPFNVQHEVNQLTKSFNALQSLEEYLQSTDRRSPDVKSERDSGVFTKEITSFGGEADQRTRMNHIAQLYRDIFFDFYYITDELVWYGVKGNVSRIAFTLAELVYSVVFNHEVFKKWMHISDTVQKLIEKREISVTPPAILKPWMKQLGHFLSYFPQKQLGIEPLRQLYDRMKRVFPED